MKDIKIKKIFSFIWQIASYIVLFMLFFVVLFLIFYIGSNIVARKTNTHPLISIFTIVSPSMEPTIMTNDIIVDFRVKNQSDLKEEDVITFYSDTLDTGGYTVTHRIKYITSNLEYITKGDNNQVNDAGTVKFNNIVGRVKYIIPKAGLIYAFVGSPTGWIVLILIPTLLIVISDLNKIYKLTKTKKEVTS